MLQATFNWGMSWVDDEGNVVRPADSAIMAGYKLSSIGALPIPDQATSGTEFDLPFFAMNSASLFMIRNKTGQELNMAWGGNWFPHLPVDGMFVWASPAPPAAGQVSALRFMLTQTQQGLGKIVFRIFGQ